MHNRLLIV